MTEHKASGRPKVFISYAHEGDLGERVDKLATWLQSNGVDVISDRDYDITPPAEGWRRWMKRSIDDADKVLVVCTKRYKECFEGSDDREDGGFGAQWEGAIIGHKLYFGRKNTKYYPILPDSGKHEHLLEVLSEWYNNFRFPSENHRILRLVSAEANQSPKSPTGAFRDWLIKKIDKLMSFNDRFRTFVAEAMGESGKTDTLASELVNTGLSNFWQAADYENRDTDGEFLESFKKLIFFLAQAACNPTMIDTLKQQLAESRPINAFELRTRYAEMGALVLSAALGKDAALSRGDGEMQLKSDHLISMCDAYLNESGFDSSRVQSDAIDVLMRKFKLDVKLGANYETRRKDLEQILRGRADRLKHVAVAHYGTGPLNIPHIVDFIVPYETSDDDNITLVGDAGLYDLICDILGELDSRKKLKNRGTI